MFTVFVFKYRKSILYLYIKYTIDQVYLYLAMYWVFVFVIGILMLVFYPSLILTLVLKSFTKVLVLYLCPPKVPDYIPDFK